MTQRIAVGVLLLAGLAQTPLATAQPVEMWAGLSAGAAWPPVMGNGGAQVSAGRRLALRLGYDQSTDWAVRAPRRTVQMASLSAGGRVRRGHLHATASAGPSAVWGRGRVGVRPGEPGGEAYRTAGLALHGAVFVEENGLGFGVDLVGNVNPEASTLGVRLATRVRLR